MQPHDSDPSMNGPLGSDKATHGDHELSGLALPHGIPLAARVAELLHTASPDALAEAREIMFDAESRPLLTFIGEHLGRCLSPSHVSLALDLLRLKSLPCTEGLLWSLMSREHRDVRHSEPPALAGPEMVPLRRELAKFCLNPGLYFSDSVRASRPREVERLAFYPLVPLRRCASLAEAPILIREATTGGFDPQMNSRALEALTYLEDGNPTHRVVPGRMVAALVGTMSDLLREPYNREETYAFVDRWLRKAAKGDATEAAMVRDAVHALWKDYCSAGAASVSGRGVSATDLMTLMRHFDDPLSTKIIKEALDSADAGVATVAMLCRADTVRDALGQLMAATLSSTRLPERLSVLAAFAYSISDDVDTRILPVFRYTVSRAFGDLKPDHDPTAVGAERSTLISAFTRRLHTQPLRSPFTAGGFAEAMRLDVAGSSFLASSLLSITRTGRLMRFSFYDDPGLLTPIGVTIELLRHQANRKNRPAAEVAGEIERHFLVDGPARFGFELRRIED
jgi:hypothetical protein